MIKIWPWSQIAKLNDHLFFQIERNANLIAYNARLEGFNDKEKAQVAAGLRIISDRDQTIATLKSELATALDALRIADERADKNAVAWVAAQKTISGLQARLLGLTGAGNLNAKIGTFQTNQPVSFNERPVNVSAIPKDRRRTKANSTEKRTATAPGGARLVLKNVEHDNRDSEKAYADAVKESEND